MADATSRGSHGPMPVGIHPMYVLPVKSLLAMDKLVPHETLLEQGVLETWSPALDGRVLCVSHQWLSFQEPDPEREHFSCLRRVLQRLAEGSAGPVEEFWLHKLYYPECKAWAAECRGSLQEMYVWIDYCSTPQVNAHCHRDVALVAKRAVKSIPAYFERCSLLLVLAPLCKHHDTGLPCNYATWRSRGWCRLELLAASLSPRQARAIVCQGPEAPMHIISPCDMSRLVPAEGHYSCCSLGHQLHNRFLPCDRKRVGSVVQSVISATIAHRFLLNRRTEALYWSAVAHVYTDGWGPQAVHASAGKGKTKRRTEAFCQSESHDTYKDGRGPPSACSSEGKTKSRSMEDSAIVDAFKKRLGWKPVDEENSKRTGLTLLMLASFTKSADVLRALIAMGHDPNERIRCYIQNIPPCVTKGFRPLMSAMLYGTPETVEALLDARADPLARAHGSRFSPLVYATVRGRADNVQQLLRRVPNWPMELTDKNGLTVACVASLLPVVTIEASAPVLRALLDAGAHHHTSDCWGGAGGCMIMAALSEDTDLRVLELLLERGHDVNERWQCRDRAMAAQMLAMRLRARCSRRRFAQEVAMLDGATSLHCAAKRGDVEMIRFLLDAKADTSVRNAQRCTPLDVARRFQGGHAPEILEALLRPGPGEPAGPEGQRPLPPPDAPPSRSVLDGQV